MAIKIDWTTINSQSSIEARNTEISRQLNNLINEYNTIPLEDCLLNKERGGQQFIQLMDKRQNDDAYDPITSRGRFKIRVLRHRDGSTPKEGDIFKWVHGQKTHYKDELGKMRPMNTKQADRMRKRSRMEGDENDIRIWRKYKLDKDCSFDCSFNDAMAVMINMSQFSIYPENSGSDGYSPTTWYWLVEEVLPSDTTEIKTKK